jgi:3-hydroxyisobutyrate dehydrogenase-like beta-hydroxyacid dehydrogenase
MGAPMAKNLLKNSYQLNVYDLKKEATHEFSKNV